MTKPKSGKIAKDASIRRKTYPIAFKRCVIRHYDSSKNISLTSRNLKIDRCNISKWIKNREKIFNNAYCLEQRNCIKNDQKKKSWFPESENRVFEWFQEQKLNHHNILGIAIQTKMLEDLKNHNVAGKL